MTQAFRQLDNRYGGGHSRSVINSYLGSIVSPLLKDSHRIDPDRMALFAAAAEMNHLAGWMAYDTGHPDVGRQHLRQALRLCQEAGDDRLSSEMLSGMSHQAAFHGSADSAVDLAIAAGDVAKRSGSRLLQAESAVMESHGLALQGEKTASLAALRSAESAFSAAECEELPVWLQYFDHAYLAAKFAHTFCELGAPREAEQFARRSLEMSDGYERGRLFNTALLARTLVEQRRIDEACAAALEATAMTALVRSMRGTTYLTDLGQRLAPYSSSPTVRSLYERFIDAGVPTPNNQAVSWAGKPKRAEGRPATQHR